ncbi:MAG: alkaline phosphatase family protein, partial [Acidobacteriota bacterium]
MAPTTRVALRVCAATMAGCCLLALGATSAGQFRKGAPARRWREIAVLFLLAPLIVNASTLVGLGKAAGTPDHPNPGRLVVEGVNPEQAGGGRRLLVVGLDAASMDQILPLASVRELPAFERFLEQGAWGRLNSLRPCLSGVAWATLLTGTMPWTSGVRADSIFHLLPGGETLQVL